MPHKMKKLVVSILLSIATFSVSAGGVSEEMRKKQDACRELSSYPQIAGCHQSLLQESDAALNKEYKELVSYFSGTNEQNLNDAQKKWIRFRDADCHFSEPRNGDGSITSANRAACLADRTIERLKHLEDYNVPWNKGCNGCPW